MDDYISSKDNRISLNKINRFVGTSKKYISIHKSCAVRYGFSVKNLAHFKFDVVIVDINGSVLSGIFTISRQFFVIFVWNVPEHSTLRNFSSTVFKHFFIRTKTTYFYILPKRQK